jgi:hypothetical protein
MRTVRSSGLWVWDIRNNGLWARDARGNGLYARDAHSRGFFARGVRSSGLWAWDIRNNGLWARHTRSNRLWACDARSGGLCARDAYSNGICASGDRIGLGFGGNRQKPDFPCAGLAHFHLRPVALHPQQAAFATPSRLISASCDSCIRSERRNLINDQVYMIEPELELCLEALRDCLRSGAGGAISR